MHSDRVRHALSLDLFHMLDRSDLEAEVRRLNEKHERYLQGPNECTERTTKRIEQLKTFLRDTPCDTATCSGSPRSECDTLRRRDTGTSLEQPLPSLQLPR